MVFARQVAGGGVSHVGTCRWFPLWRGVGRLWLHLCMQTIVIIYNTNSDLCQHCEILEEGNQETCALRCCLYPAGHDLVDLWHQCFRVQSCPGCMWSKVVFCFNVHVQYAEGTPVPENVCIWEIWP